MPRPRKPLEPMTLRRLRMWHWHQVLLARTQAVRHEGLAAGGSTIAAADARLAHRRANLHLGAVQVLNDFFPDDGDTAERDYSDAGVS